jgi:hypothetical protein
MSTDKEFYNTNGSRINKDCPPEHPVLAEAPDQLDSSPANTGGEIIDTHNIPEKSEDWDGTRNNDMTVLSRRIVSLELKTGEKGWDPDSDEYQHVPKSLTAPSYVSDLEGSSIYVNKNNPETSNTADGTENAIKDNKIIKQGDNHSNSLIRLDRSIQALKVRTGLPAVDPDNLTSGPNFTGTFMEGETADATPDDYSDLITAFGEDGDATPDAPEEQKIVGAGTDPDITPDKTSSFDNPSKTIVPAKLHTPIEEGSEPTFPVNYSSLDAVTEAVAKLDYKITNEGDLLKRAIDRETELRIADVDQEEANRIQDVDKEELARLLLANEVAAIKKTSADDDKDQDKRIKDLEELVKALGESGGSGGGGGGVAIRRDFEGNQNGLGNFITTAEKPNAIMTYSFPELAEGETFGGYDINANISYTYVGTQSTMKVNISVNKEYETLIHWDEPGLIHGYGSAAVSFPADIETFKAPKGYAIFSSDLFTGGFTSNEYKLGKHHANGFTTIDDVTISAIRTVILPPEEEVSTSVASVLSQTLSVKGNNNVTKDLHTFEFTDVGTTVNYSLDMYFKIGNAMYNLKTHIDSDLKSTTLISNYGSDAYLSGNDDVIEGPTDNGDAYTGVIQPLNALKFTVADDNSLAVSISSVAQYTFRGVVTRTYSK